jgi:tetratricopeptide (TPR) repeat protein
MRRSFVFLISLFVAGALFANNSSGSSGGSSSGGGGGATKVASSTPSALDWYNRGFAASDAGKYQDAINDFQQAISLKADYAEAYNMLGFSTRKIGKVKDAFAYYEKALTLKSNFPEAREYYGEAFLQEGNLAKAVQQYIILQKAGTKNAGELLEKIDEFVNMKS